MSPRRTFIGLLLALAWSATAAATPPHRHSVEVDGFQLTVWEKSARQPQRSILLVHGRTWSALPNFDLQVPGEHRSILEALAALGYAAYAVDLRGYGATPRDGGGWLTPQRAADDVTAILQWIDKRHSLPSRPVLLGYSRGSHVSLLVAQQHAQAMSALVLFALPPLAARPRETAPAEPPRRATTREAAAEDFITPGAASRAVIDAYVEQAVTSDPVRTDWRDEHEFVFDAAKVTAPTLLLYGKFDPLFNDAARAFLDSLATRDRKLVVLPDSDHAAHVENSQAAWLRAVDDFVKKPRANGTAR